MKNLALLIVSCLCWTLAPFFVTSAQDAVEPASVFSQLLKKDDSVLKENPTIAKGHVAWKAKIGEASAVYVDGLESLLAKEKSKGDFDAVKSLERAIVAAKSQHSTPCLLFDRLPPKAAALLADLNKAKSKENKVFVSMLEKETTAALKQKGSDEAKKIESFLYSMFLPESMETLFSQTVRLDNKIYLLIDGKKNWTEAFDWCRERNGDLASIGNKTIHLFLLKYLTKLGKVRGTFVGGARIGSVWLWTDGTPFAFSAWAKGQPSGKREGGIVEDRLEFAFRDNGEWNDLPGEYQLPFIIQWTLY